MAACNTGNEAYEGATAIQIIERTAGEFPALSGWFINHRCYHCTDAPCVNHCPVDALYKENGLTRLDRHKCIACERCVEVCPYDIPHIVRGRSFKCDGCNNLVKAGGTPWCVKTCPTRALEYGDRNQILAEAYARVGALRGRYPNAQVVGDSAEFDLGVILVLPDAPEVVVEVAPSAAPAAEAAEPGEFNLLTAVDNYLSSIPEGFMSVSKLEAFMALLESGEAVVIDVREIGEYEAGHIPSAINIPIRTVMQHLDLIPSDKPVVIYCLSGHRAALVVSALRMLGYDNVRGFPGGWKAWDAAGEEVSLEAAVAEPVEPKEVSPEMFAAVDAFLTSIPEGFYSVGTVERLTDAIDAGAVLVDVREPGETAEGVIPDALTIPIRTLVDNLEMIPSDQPVILYCASGFRAGLSLTALHVLGYTNVRSFPPGYGAWEAAAGN